MIRMERRAEPPAALDPARPDSYGHATVVLALEEDFDHKCYLCESHRRAAQVEHLRPRTAFPERATAWDNLFLACGGSCNQRRIHWETRANALIVGGESVRWPVEGMLDPCCDDVEARLQQRVVHVDGRLRASFVAADPTDGAASNTAAELQAIHEKRQGQAICEDIQRWHGHLQGLLNVALVDGNGWDELRLSLDRSAPFAGLMRTRFRDLLRNRPDLVERLAL